MARRAWALSVVVGTSLLVAALSACGGGSEPGPSPAPAPGPTDYPIQARKPLYQPSGNKKLLFLGQDLVALGGVTDGATTYAGGHLNDVTLKSLPVGLTTYLQVMDNQGLTTTFHNSGEEKNAELTATHAAFGSAKPLIAIGYFLDNHYDTLTSGGRDAQLKALADWIKAKGLPVFLRIGYEFNGSWTGHPQNRLGYVNAFRYIASKLQGYGAMNVAFVWQSDGQGTEAELATYYPGDAYVDWVAYSHFDNKGEGLLALAKTHAKPVMIAEAAPVRWNLGKAGDADGQAAWDGWFAPLFAHINANPQIRALAYINDNWPAKPMWKDVDPFNKTDSRIQASPFVKARWVAEITNGTWFTRAEVPAAIGL